MEEAVSVEQTQLLCLGKPFEPRGAHGRVHVGTGMHRKPFHGGVSTGSSYSNVRIVESAPIAGALHARLRNCGL